MMMSKNVVTETGAVFLSVLVVSVCAAQQFTWTRTGQAVGTTGTVQTWTNQGGMSSLNTPPDPNPGDDTAAGQIAIWDPAVNLP